MDKFYLRQNVQAEPLFCRWYAWTHLIPPATAARNITHRYMKILDSYLESPGLHASAVKNPQLLGGPFIDVPEGSEALIEDMRNQMLLRCKPLFDLSVALEQLDHLVRSQARGFSLQPLYQNIPDLLKGYVELTYDLNNQPAYRLLEPLLYRSKFMLKSEQAIALSLIGSDERPFVLSTPRVDLSGVRLLEIPFDDPAVDEIFKLKSYPQPLDFIQEILGDRQSIKDCEPLFTKDPPRRYQRYAGSGVRWRYFGHACILIESRGVSLLFDPVVSYVYPSSLNRYTYEDLPDFIDYVFITHNHQDHVLFETIFQLRHKVGTFVVPKGRVGALQDPSLRLILKQVGCGNIVELGEMDMVAIEGGSVTAVPFFGEHADLDIQSKSAYLVRHGEKSMLFAADSCVFDAHLYSRVREIIGCVDVVFLGMECDGAPLSWLYGPLLTGKMDRAMDQSRRLAGSDYPQARNLVSQFAPKEVYVYAMGQEPWLNYIMSIKYSEKSRPITESNKLIAECIEKKMVAERLFGEKEIFLDT